jgi:hypothetical protein
MIIWVLIFAGVITACLSASLRLLSWHTGALGSGPRLLSGDTASPHRYQDFFALWKDADPDIPILKEAKAEYAKLK